MKMAASRENTGIISSILFAFRTATEEGKCCGILGTNIYLKSFYWYRRQIYNYALILCT